MVAWTGEQSYWRLRASIGDSDAASRRVLAELGFRETNEMQPDAVRGASLPTVLDLWLASDRSRVVIGLVGPP